MSISTPFIRRPVGTSLFIAALVLVGLAAYPLLPVAPHQPFKPSASPQPEL
jgi:multidrug efflux pump subunit AcrB